MLFGHSRCGDSSPTEEGHGSSEPALGSEDEAARSNQESQAAREVGTLNLLMRDGAIFMDFRPSLSERHYGELLKLTHELVTIAEMRKAVRLWAKARGLKVSFDELERE